MHRLLFCSKVILAFDLINIIDIREDTDRQTSPNFFLFVQHCVSKLGLVCLSVCSRMSIFPPKSKAIWFSAKILIEIRNLSFDIAILIWILILEILFIGDA